MQISTESIYDLDNYDFVLPKELIADRPVSPRDHSKLLVYHVAQDKVEHRHFYDIQDYLGAGDRIYFNNSKVFPSRLFGTKASGGKAEVLLIEPRSVENKFLVMLRSNGKKSQGDAYNFQGLSLEVVENRGHGLFWVKSNFSEEQVLQHFFKFGMLAIPPYIRRGLADQQDSLDYQTIYASQLGSVAAPTAGLHFTENLLKKLQEQGVQKEEVTLHVGPGTFLPIEVQNILDHQMHAEFFTFSKSAWDKLTSKEGRTFAVGTTTLRVLESCFREYRASGLTNIFLHPGKKIESIHGLITNFHLPKSTLMILVSALIGIDKTKELYQLAIENKYRFFSYGDAMLIIR